MRNSKIKTATIIKKIKTTYYKIKRILEEKILHFIHKALNEYYIDAYTKEDLSTSDELYIASKFLSKREINNFIYINESAEIIITDLTLNINERNFFKELTEIFKILEKHNRTYNIKIRVKNRELLKRSGLLKHTDNINLTINNQYTDYTKEEYLENEKQLDAMIEPIKKI